MADRAKWLVTQALLEREIEKAREGHEEKGRREKKVIGFGG